MKTNIRLILLLAVIILGVTMMVAQTAYKDVLYLKNGSVIKGVIIETVPEKSIKIETADGNIFVYNMSEVEKIAKEKDTAAPSKEPKPVVEPQRSSEPQRSYESQQSSEGAGSKFSIFGGVALPLGDFGKKDGENAGMAKTGWTAGAQLVTGGSVGFIIEGSYTLNKYDLPMDWTQYPPAGKYEWTGYSSILALAGIKFGTDNATGSNFFIAPLVGALFATSPKIDFTPEGTSTSITKYPSGKGTAVAYGVAIQGILGDHITLSAKYIASKPKFKYTVESPYPGVPSREVESDPVNIAIAFVTLGLAF